MARSASPSSPSPRSEGLSAESEVNHFASEAYQEGQVLRLRVGDADSASEPVIDAQIYKLLRPWTLSVVMVIDIRSSPNALKLPSRAFLKLYDRRFADQYRDTGEIGRWTPDTEKQLQDFSRSGGAAVFLDMWRNDPDFNDNEGKWTPAESEAYASEELRESYESEMAVYRLLASNLSTLLDKVYLKLV